MNRTIRRKLRGRGGFSLTEMLLCVLILMSATALITQTLDLGIRQFRARTRESEARILCNTLSLAVQDQLTYAKSADFSKPTPTFVSGAKGMGDVICSFETTEDGMLALRYMLNGNSYLYPLADDAAYARDGDLQVKEFRLEKGVYGGFAVSITVNSKSQKIQEAVNQFTVTPVLAGAAEQS